jgi:hypothetical protein
MARSQSFQTLTEDPDLAVAGLTTGRSQDFVLGKTATLTIVIHDKSASSGDGWINIAIKTPDGDYMELPHKGESWHWKNGRSLHNDAFQFTDIPAGTYAVHIYNADAMVALAIDKIYLWSMESGTR